MHYFQNSLLDIFSAIMLFWWFCLYFHWVYNFRLKDFSSSLYSSSLKCSSFSPDEYDLQGELGNFLFHWLLFSFMCVSFSVGDFFGDFSLLNWFLTIMITLIMLLFVCMLLISLSCSASLQFSLNWKFFSHYFFK